jgi:hypothetical protein
MACQCDSCKTKRTNDSVTGSGFFAVEQLGPKQSFTPEGYLLCEEVPIARIGVQDYAAMELDGIEDKDGVIEVERTEDEVFSPDTIASFLGKPVTLNHPGDPVTPDTWAYLAKGTAHNVRRGQGEQSDLLIADLLITDKGAINEIRNNGLKEISCGYDAEYEQIAPGRARQTSIVGNHVALVKNARCGPVCSVQDSSKLLGDQPMAGKKPAQTSGLLDKLRKAFMTRDADEFEKAVGEMKDEDGMEKNMPDIHIHMPGAEKANASEDTKDDESEADPMAKVMTALDGIAQGMAALGERVSALESGKTNDSGEEKKDEETEDDAEEMEESEETNDSDEEEEKKDDEKKSTSDSASFRDEFQDAKARAEILAPGVKLPTYDAKADSKKTSDSLCVLRRRALKAALTNDNGDLVRMITGDADVSKMDCAAAKMAFHAASELVKQKNKTAKTSTADSQSPVKKDLNQIHADFWAKRK